MFIGLTWRCIVSSWSVHAVAVDILLAALLRMGLGCGPSRVSIVDQGVREECGI